MADDARQPRPDLKPPAPLAETFDFFELLRRLEREGAREGKLFGHAGSPEAEPARLGQHVRLGFAVTDVAAFQPRGAAGPARVTVANLGLLGPEGPLPIHITRWVLDRLSQRWFAGSDQRETTDTTFVDFANILQHRLMALFYRAWADAHPEVQVERAGGSGLRSMLRAMAGIGLPGTGSETDPVRLRQAAALAQQPESPERLALFLSEAFRVPVAVREFVASWIAIPAALQTRVGRAFAGLGRGATIGPRVFSRENRVELRLGPLKLDAFRSFLPGGARREALRTAVRELAGSTLDVDLRLVLARDCVPQARLGAAELGRTAWLARPEARGDAEDMLCRAFVGWRPAPAEALA